MKNRIGFYLIEMLQCSWLYFYDGHKMEYFDIIDNKWIDSAYDTPSLMNCCKIKKGFTLTYLNGL